MQRELSNLKLNYSKKKETLVHKLNNHQVQIEEIFKIYYDTLDTMRNDMLQ